MNTLPVNCIECGVEFHKSIYYIKQGEKRGHKNHFCSNKCSIIYNSKLLPSKKLEREKEYYQNPKKCPNCQGIIPYRSKNTYCSSTCSATYIQKDGGNHHWSEEDKKKISEWAKQHAHRPNPKKDEKIKKICLNCNIEFEILPFKRKQKCCSKLCSNKWIIKNKILKGKTGGFREKGGRGKQGWYKGYYCNSSWELAWVIYNLDNNIGFKRNTEGFEYEFNGTKYKFYPDFILESGEYVEIKAFLDEKNKAKIKHFPHKLNLIQKVDIQPFIKYAKEKYGEDYIRLYK